MVRIWHWVSWDFYLLCPLPPSCSGGAFLLVRGSIVVYLCSSSLEFSRVKRTYADYGYFLALLMGADMYLRLMKQLGGSRRPGLASTAARDIKTD